MKSILLIFGLFILISMQACKDEKSEIIYHESHEPSRKNMLFSDAVETEDLMFLAGQIGKRS